MTRSRIASASVGIPIMSCQRSTGTWLVMMRRSLIIAVFDDFEEIARLLGREGFRPPIVEDEQFDASDGAQQPGVTRIAMRDRQIGEEPGDAGIENGHVFSAGTCARAHTLTNFCPGRRRWL